MGPRAKLGRHSAKRCTGFDKEFERHERGGSGKQFCAGVAGLLCAGKDRLRLSRWQRPTKCLVQRGQNPGVERGGHHSSGHCRRNPLASLGWRHHAECCQSRLQELSPYLGCLASRDLGEQRPFTSGTGGKGNALDQLFVALGRFKHGFAAQPKGSGQRRAANCPEVGRKPIGDRGRPLEIGGKLQLKRDAFAQEAGLALRYPRDQFLDLGRSCAGSGEPG